MILILWVLIFIHISYTVFSATVIYTYSSCILWRCYTLMLWTFFLCIWFHPDDGLERAETCGRSSLCHSAVSLLLITSNITLLESFSFWGCFPFRISGVSWHPSARTKNITEILSFSCPVVLRGTDFYTFVLSVVLVGLSQKTGFHRHYPFVLGGNNVYGSD